MWSEIKRRKGGKNQSLKQEESIQTQKTADGCASWLFDEAAGVAGVAGVTERANTHDR